MKKKIQYSVLSLLLLSGIGCTADLPTDQDPAGEPRQLTLQTSVEPFVGGVQTRVSMDGKGWEKGDRMRVKIICPYVTSNETAESTYDNTSDGMWLQKWTGSGWTRLTSADKCDLDGDGRYSDSRDLQDQCLSQQTPYVFTASSWSREVSFVKADGSNMRGVITYVPVFHADQRREADFKDSDLLWAQSIMQTGTDYVRLNFRHVMALLVVTVEGAVLDDPVLTLEGMPDIDQQEIVVGDHFAKYSKVNGRARYEPFGYKNRYRCAPDENGQVLGIGTYDTNDQVKPLSKLAQDAVYTCYRDADKQTFRLIVPPCAFTGTYPTLWLRDGDKRWSLRLNPTDLTTAAATDPESAASVSEEGTLRFKQGECYPLTMTIQ